MTVKLCGKNSFIRGYSSFFNLPESLYICRPARVAKLVDALCSGRSIRKVVLVRIQSRAQKPLIEDEGFFILPRVGVSGSPEHAKHA